ncbi:MAG: magnesium chelatase domain-containing protein, partial [Nitrobacter sp.]
IAIGILAATAQLPANELSAYEFAGELALTGALRPIRGALAMPLSARRDGRAFVLPAASAAGVALVRDAVVHPATSLLAVFAHLTGRERIAPLDLSLARQLASAPAPTDLADVRGQMQAKRALTIAAAGAHSLLIL